MVRVVLLRIMKNLEKKIVIFFGKSNAFRAKDTLFDFDFKIHDILILLVDSK